MAALNLYFWFCLPFMAVLLSVAIFPAVWPKFWNKFHLLLLLTLSLPSLLLAFSYNPQWVLHGALTYIDFIFLLGALYKIGGGLYVTGAPKANPLSNIAFILLGLVISNLIGTLGASMLLIRPMLRSNRGRKHEKHIILFFIFIVSNCAGMLTPMGDPPLLYGYLMGVPFAWSLKLFPIWFFINSLLIAVFAALDSYFFIRDPDFRGPLKSETKEPFKIQGRWNLVLAGLCVGVLALPQWLTIPAEGWNVAIRSGGLLLIIYLSDKLTPRQIISLNNFSWEPFKEVMVIFAAIFSTIILTSKYLESISGQFQSSLNPWMFYWVTGILSAFLDNAPSYASMLSIASSLPESLSCISLKNGKCVEEIYLMAISAGSVAFGALTYIGNAPNLLIKAVAEREGLNPPTFFGYIGWASLFLIPTLLLTALLFFI